MSPTTLRNALARRARVARARRSLYVHAGDDVGLATIARAAGTSLFHLARLHRAITGETLGQARTLVRIERAARLLLASDSPISAIALEVGFATPSSFGKAFRAALGVSATAFRTASPTERRAKLALLPGRSPVAFELSAEPQLRAIEDVRVAFVRETGAYAEIAAPLAWAKLEACLARTPLARAPRIGASYDDSISVPSQSLRYDAAVMLAHDTRAPAGTREATWPGGRYALFEHRGDYRSIAAAFARIFETWDPRARRGAACLELYRAPGVTELGVPV
jgi:AraC family transcriptional regulator